RVAQRAAECAPRVDLRSARRAGVQVLQDLVVRLRQQLIAQKRVGDFANVTTVHDASSTPLFRIFGDAPADGRPSTGSAAASSVLNGARPGWSVDITVPIGIARASAASLYDRSSMSQRRMTSWNGVGNRRSEARTVSSVSVWGTGGTNGTVCAMRSSGSL